MIKPIVIHEMKKSTDSDKYEKIIEIILDLRNKIYKIEKEDKKK